MNYSRLARLLTDPHAPVPSQEEARDLVAMILHCDPKDVIVQQVQVQDFPATTVDETVPAELLGAMGRRIDDGGLHHDGPDAPPFAHPGGKTHVTGAVTGEAGPTKHGPSLDTIFNEVRREVDRAVVKHGSMKSAHEGASVIREEYEELWDEVKADRGYQSSARSEAVQLAAMAIRYLYDLDPGRSRV